MSNTISIPYGRLSVTRQVSHVEHLSSPRFLVEFVLFDVWFSVWCFVDCCLDFVLFLLTIVLSALLRFGIFKLFLMGES